MTQNTVFTPSENAELVRRGYAAFNSADLETLSEMFDEKAWWHTPGRSSIGGDRQGRKVILGHFGRYGSETAGTFKAELRELFVSDDGRVVALHRNTGERNGRHLDVDCLLVFEIRDGRVVDGRETFYDLHAWEEFWS